MRVLSRRRLEMALGALWLLDGALQLQPTMFTRTFFSNVLGMANMGLPGPLARLDFAVTDLVVAHPAVWNTAFALLQLALGVALLRGGRAARWARPVSVAWALAVWVVGEGLGGVFMGGASVLNGAPGAAILYAFATVLLWPRGTAAQRTGPDRAVTGDGSIATAGVIGRGAVGTWTVTWLVVALLEVAGPNHLPYVPGAEITDSADGEPAPLAAVNRAVGSVVGFHGVAFAVTLGLAAAAVALLPLVRRWRRPALVAGMVMISFLGVVGGDLGGVFTGTGTDPGLAPLAVLLGLALWPARAPVGGELPDEPGAGDRGGATASRAVRRAPRHPVPVAAR